MSNVQRALGNMIVYSSNVKVYVPSTQKVSHLIDNSAIVLSVETQLANMFGGATAYNALGAWVCEDGRTVTEPVTIVQAYCTTDQLEQHIASVVNICANIKAELSQEAVALEVNNQLYFI